MNKEGSLIIVGIDSSGMVYCGVVGHSSRMEYIIFGPPVERAAKIMQISNAVRVAYARATIRRFSKEIKDFLFR